MDSDSSASNRENSKYPENKLNYPFRDLSNEKVLFLFNKLTGVAPYTHEFVAGGNDPHLLASFVSAMSNFMEEVLGSKQPHWRTEYGTNATLLVEEGEWVVGCLAVSRETNEARSKLRRIVKEFEESFAALKYDDFFEGGIFEEFDKFSSRTFLGDRLTENTRVWKAANWSEMIGMHNLPSTAFQNKKFLLELQDGLPIKSISNRSDVSYEKYMTLITQSVWNGATYLQYIPTMNDILSIPVGSISTILNTQNPLNLSINTMLVISSLTGLHPIKNYVELIESSHLNETLIELGMLTTQGFLQKITLEQSILLMNWCILKRLAKMCLRYIDAHKFEDLIQSIMQYSIIDHPWLGRVRISPEGTVSLELSPHMTPSDLDQVYEDIDFLIQCINMEIKGNRWLEESFVQKLRKQLIRNKCKIKDIREECSRIWMEYLKGTSF